MDLYRITHFGPSVGLGVSGAVHLGIAAVGKPNGAGNPYVLSNEIVAAEIGRYLRLPIPPSCVVSGPSGDSHYASLNFNLTGAALPPVIPTNFYNEFEEHVGLLLLFDAYIGNSDRHTGNLSADYGAHRFNVFDHSHCLLSGTHPQGKDRLTSCQTELVIDGGLGGNRHCLIDQIRDDRLFRDGLDRIESLPEWFLGDVVGEAAEYGLTAEERSALLDFLKDRRVRMRQIVQDHKASFPAIAVWSFL